MPSERGLRREAHRALRVVLRHLVADEVDLATAPWPRRGRAGTRTSPRHCAPRALTRSTCCCASGCSCSSATSRRRRVFQRAHQRRPRAARAGASPRARSRSSASLVLPAPRRGAGGAAHSLHRHAAPAARPVSLVAQRKLGRHARATAPSSTSARPARRAGAARRGRARGAAASCALSCHGVAVIAGRRQHRARRVRAAHAQALALERPPRGRRD